MELAGPTYPNFDICKIHCFPALMFDRGSEALSDPAVYPYFDIYRSGVVSTPVNWCESCRVELGAKYPSMVICKYHVHSPVIFVSDRVL